MSIKIQSIGALFVALVIILAINPTIVHNMYGSILGRLFLVSIVIFFAINNITLGLLIVLTIITALNQYGSFVEGFEKEKESTSAVTIGEDNTNVTGVKQVLTDTSSGSQTGVPTNSSSETQNETVGIDKITAATTIMSKDSKNIRIDPNMNSSAEVNAASSGMLNAGSATLEGFSSYATL
jgi:hypothetical protein